MTAVTAEHSATIVGRRWGLAALCMAGLGATLGTLLDGIHSHAGATRYTTPVFWEAAWWVPPLFAGAFSIGLLRPVVDRGPAPSGQAAALSMGLFVLAYAASVLPLAWPLVSAILLGIFALSYLAFDRTRIGLAICLGGAVGGPLVEVTLVHLGLFSHTKPAFASVSGWLPFLYMCAGVGLQNLASWLVDGGSVMRRDHKPREAHGTHSKAPQP